MKKVLIAGLALFVSGSAMAADLPVLATKAPRSVFTYPAYDGSGFYWGVNVEAGVAQGKVGGTFAGSLVGGNLTAAGGSVGGTVGWMKGNGTSWFALEASGDYQNITASNSGIATLGSRWAAEQVVKLGGFQQPLAWLSNLGINFPALPVVPTPPGFNIAANTSHPYVMAGIREFGLTSNFINAGGHTWEAAPMIGAGVLNQLLDSTGKVGGAVLDVGAKVVFANKGFTFDVINNPGLSGSAKMGTQYIAYAKVLF